MKFLVSIQCEGSGFMYIRKSLEKDLEKILKIYEAARDFMAQNGNPTQWGDSYPTAELIKGDIEKDGYVVVEDDEIVGVFVLEKNAAEEAYKNIDGAWLDDKPYGVVHRCASGGTCRGVGKFLLNWCFDMTGNIRIDTHENNSPMIKLLTENGYRYCGKICYLQAGERIAYQKNIVE